MNLQRIIFIGLLLVFTACSNDDNNTSEIDPLPGMQLTKEISNESHTLEIYTATGNFQLGYNEVFFRIKDENTEEYEKDLNLSWQPVMHMNDMNHTAPFSEISKISEGVYSAYVVFQMPGNADNYWELNFDFEQNGTQISLSDEVAVANSDSKNVIAFEGEDGKKYVLALIVPQEPKMAQQEMIAGLFEMKSMTEYAVVDDYTIKIDPRMPAMENHSSPNNTDLFQKGEQGFYKGKLSLSMTGYWQINMQVLNVDKEIIKGEPISDEHQESSLYFELEF